MPKGACGATKQGAARALADRRLAIQQCSYTRRMTRKPASDRYNRHVAAAIATVAMHVGVVLLWQWSHLTTVDTLTDDGPRIQWVNVKPVRPVARPAGPPEQQAVVAVTRRTARVPAALPAPAEAVPVAAEAQASEPAPAPPTAAPPARTVDEVMQQARRDLGSISKELKKEFPGPKVRAPVDTPQSRLEKGIALAYELAPPKWYEANKVVEMNVADSPGTRRYRVITAKGTYCITVGPTHTATGLTMNGNANPHKMTNCPKDEAPATVQKYDERP